MDSAGICGSLRSLPGRIRRRVLGVLGHAGSAQAGELRTFEIAYVILLSDEVHNCMSKLQLDILKRYGANPGLKAIPHITLKLGFRVAEIAPFELYFDKLASETEPFEIRVKGIGFFDEGIIFVDVEPNPHLEKLRRQILSDLAKQHGIEPYPLEGDRYHFHATLAYGLPKRDFAKARRELQGLQLDFRFVLDTLALFCHTGEEWIAYKRAAVQKYAAKP